MLGWSQVHHALRARGRRHDAHTTGALQQHIAQLATALDDVGQGALGRQAQQHVNVGQAQVGVQQHDPTAKLSQRQ
ncbi:hypothetical protein D3C85_801570 [compost metagenome]